MLGYMCTLTSLSHSPSLPPSLSLSPSLPLTSTAPKFNEVGDNFSLCVVARLLLQLGTDVAKLAKQVIPA